MNGFMYDGVPFDEQLAIRTELYRYGGKSLKQKLADKRQKLRAQRLPTFTNHFQGKTKGGALTKRQKARFLMNPWFGAISLAVETKRKKKEIAKMMAIINKHGLDKVYNAIMAVNGYQFLPK